MTTEERRKEARRPASLKVSYRTVGDTLVDPLKDLSLGGAFLFCRSPLPLGTVVELLIGDGREDPLLLEGRVVRVVWGGRRAGDVVEPGMALSFSALTKHKQERLAALLAVTSTDRR